jgi:hypothetical protein
LGDLAKLTHDMALVVSYLNRGRAGFVICQEASGYENRRSIIGLAISHVAIAFNSVTFGSSLINMLFKLPTFQIYS